MKVQVSISALLLAAFLCGGCPRPGYGGEFPTEAQRQVKTTENEERRLLAELEALEKKSSGIEDQLLEIEGDVEAISGTLERENRKIKKLSDELARSRRHLYQRLRALYTMKEAGLLQILLTAQSVDDLIRRYRFLSLILKQDREAILDYTSRQDRLHQIQAQLQNDRRQLEQLKLDLSLKKEEIFTLKKKKTGLLMKVHQQKELYLAMIKSWEESRQKLIKEVIVDPNPAQAAGSLSKIRTETAVESSPAEERRWPDFQGLKGRIPRPAPGRVTRGFGRQEGPFHTLTHRRGWAIRSKAGTEVKAVLAGEVLYTGWMKGYGNIIIVNHGQRYYTLIGGLSGIKHRAGQWVRQGEVLGVVPKGGATSNKNIYFEIRHGHKALDPAKWLGKKPVA